MRNFTVATLLLLLGLLLGATIMGAAHNALALALPYEKVVKYGALLVVLLIVTAWALREGLTRNDLGLPAGRTALHVLVGFGSTLILLLPLWLFLLAVGAREMDFLLWSKELAYRAGVYLLIGLAVATVEELYFRGVLLSGANTSNYRILLTASALLYTVVHFLRPESGLWPAQPWYGGTLMLLEAAQNLPHLLLAELPKAATLLLIGIGLALVRWHTGSLALCIGAHAAMVFSMKMFQKFTDPGYAMIPALGPDPQGGFASAVWLAILLFFVSRKLGKQA